MSAATFTPGPWTVNRRLIESGANAVAIVNVAAPEDIATADSRLIAAAPDMYAALREFVRACDCEPTETLARALVSVRAQARAAIAKATP